MASREKNLTRLLTSAGIITAGKLIGSITKLGERVVVGRLLTPGAYGEVSIGLALLAFASTFSLVGFTQGVPRYISRYDSEEHQRGVWVSGIIVTGVISLLVTIVLFSNIEIVSELGVGGHTLLSEPDSPQMLAMFVLALPFVIGLRITTAAIRGFGNAVYKAYAQDLTYPLIRILLLVALLYAGHNVIAAGYAYVAAAAVAFVVSLALLHRIISITGQFQTHIREITWFSLPVIVSSVLTTLLTRTDTLMIGFFRPSYEVGQYSAAYPIAGAMVIVISSFGFLYLPLASRLDAEDEHEEIDYIYQTTTKWIYLLTFPALVAFILFPEDVIGVFFGAQYREAGLALAILSIGFFSNAVGGRNRETISALGITEYLMVTNGGAFVLNILLNLYLIPQYGYLGAAVASAVSYIALNVIACAVLKLKFDISPFSQWSVRTFAVLPVTLLPPAYLVADYISLSAVTILPFLVVIGLLSIVVVSITGCLQPEDRVVLEFVEDAVGVRVPLIRRYMPEARDSSTFE